MPEVRQALNPNFTRYTIVLNQPVEPNTIRISSHGQAYGFDDGLGYILGRNCHGTVFYPSGSIIIEFVPSVIPMILEDPNNSSPYFSVLFNSVTPLEFLKVAIGEMVLNKEEQEKIFPAPIIRVLRMISLDNFEEYKEPEIKMIYHHLSQCNTQAFRKLIILKQYLDI